MRLTQKTEPLYHNDCFMPFLFDAPSETHLSTYVNAENIEHVQYVLNSRLPGLGTNIYRYNKGVGKNVGKNAGLTTGS